ncbi:MAG: 1-acyl-sn-glycerol-3-phosphate acyltransferase [Ruminococcaceae bacterium]|nr:1-acyl-sn-glycerol-3-phosphate acyltransferase [Oscillospiraceae bacterium]
MAVVYDICRWIGVITGYPFRWIVFKTKFYYENEKAKRKVKGGALIISNHFNTFDFVHNVFVFFPRKLYVVASEHAFKNFIIRLGMKFWGGIKADRTTKSTKFIFESIRELKKGHLVQIFPEGHNTDDGNIQSFYPSYILIALKANVPIVPLIMDGHYGLFKRVHQMIGEPIYLSEYVREGKVTKGEIERLNEIVHAKALKLREEIDLRIQAHKNKRGGKKN